MYTLLIISQYLTKRYSCPLIVRFCISSVWPHSCGAPCAAFTPQSSEEGQAWRTGSTHSDRTWTWWEFLTYKVLSATHRWVASFQNFSVVTLYSAIISILGLKFLHFCVSICMTRKVVRDNLSDCWISPSHYSETVGVALDILKAFDSLAQSFPFYSPYCILSVLSPLS